MPTIKYRVNGVEKVKQINSYYEAVVESNKLRKKGIPVTFKDNTKSLVSCANPLTRKKVECNQNQQIKKFLQNMEGLNTRNRYEKQHGIRERGKW